MTESIGLMEPLLASEGTDDLNDVAVDLVSKASSFAGMLNPVVSKSVGNLVRSMNCYYLNLIEGRDTTPREIDSALVEDFSTEPKKRAIQNEAVTQEDCPNA